LGNRIELHFFSPETFHLLRVTQKQPGNHWGENCIDMNGYNSGVKPILVKKEIYLKEQTSLAQNVGCKTRTRP